jgi:hypothetical protein
MKSILENGDGKLKTAVDRRFICTYMLTANSKKRKFCRPEQGWSRNIEEHKVEDKIHSAADGIMCMWRLERPTPEKWARLSQLRTNEGRPYINDNRLTEVKRVKIRTTRHNDISFNRLAYHNTVLFVCALA